MIKIKETKSHEQKIKKISVYMLKHILDKKLDKKKKIREESIKETKSHEKKTKR